MVQGKGWQDMGGAEYWHNRGTEHGTSLRPFHLCLPSTIAQWCREGMHGESAARRLALQTCRSPSRHHTPSYRRPPPPVLSAGKFYSLATSSSERRATTLHTSSYRPPPPSLALNAGKFYTLATGSSERRWGRMKDKLETTIHSFTVL